jgi:hypothetical protein
LTILEHLSDFVRQSIASSNVQWTIEHVLGLLVAEATIEGFEKKLGEKILEKGLQDLQSVGGAVLRRLPWSAVERQQKLGVAQEPEGLREIEEEVRSVVGAPELEAEIRPLLAKLASIDVNIFKQLIKIINIDLQPWPV